MSKAILVIDVDDKYLGKEISLIKFADDNAIYCSAKLKPMPEKLSYSCVNPATCELELEETIAIRAYNDGYNNCIDEILGEEK